MKVWNVGYIKVSPPSDQSDRGAANAYRIQVHTASRDKYRLQYRDLSTYDRMKRPVVSSGRGSYYTRPTVVQKNSADASENDRYNNAYDNNLGLQNMSCLSRCEVKTGHQSCLVEEPTAQASLQWLGH